MKEDIKIRVLEIAIEIVKADNKKLTVENIMIIYRQLVYKLYTPSGL